MKRIVAFGLLGTLATLFFVYMLCATPNSILPFIKTFSDAHPFVTLLIWMVAPVIAIISLLQIVLGLREVSATYRGAVAYGFFYTVDGLPVESRRKCMVVLYTDRLEFKVGISSFTLPLNQVIGLQYQKGIWNSEGVPGSWSAAVNCATLPDNMPGSKFVASLASAGRSPRRGTWWLLTIYGQDAGGNELEISLEARHGRQTRKTFIRDLFQMAGVPVPLDNGGRSVPL